MKNEEITQKLNEIKKIILEIEQILNETSCQFVSTEMESLSKYTNKEDK